MDQRGRTTAISIKRRGALPHTLPLACSSNGWIQTDRLGEWTPEADQGRGQNSAKYARRDADNNHVKELAGHSARPFFCLHCGWGLRRTLSPNGREACNARTAASAASTSRDSVEAGESTCSRAPARPARSVTQPRRASRLCPPSSSDSADANSVPAIHSGGGSNCRLPATQTSCVSAGMCNDRLA
jgi:hypothetical protein